MTLLPVAMRELRAACRKPVTYWIRSGTALLVLMVGLWFFLMMSRQAPQQIGIFLFSIVAGGAQLFALLSGARWTADSISVEKREGTLGLLFLTDLKGYDVVFGKLAANGINAFYGVLSMLPIMALPLLMGGVGVMEFVRMSLTVVNTLFFSLSIGMVTSVFCRQARSAYGVGFLVIMLLSGAAPLIAAILADRRLMPELSQGLFWLSPGYTFAMGYDATYRTAPIGFWGSLAVVHFLAWLSLIICSLRVTHCWQDRPAAAGGLSWRQAWRNWTYGSGEKRHAFRKALLDQNAFYWLASRMRFMPALVWAILALLLVAWGIGYRKLGREWLDESVFLMVGLVLNLLIKAWFGSEAGRQLAEDRHSGALELMLSTPMTVKDIVQGQWLTLRRVFLGPILFVLAVWFLILVFGTRGANTSDRAAWVSFWLALMVMLVVDLVALFWVGLSQALVAKNPHNASSSTVFRVLSVPWIIFALMVLLIVSGLRHASWGFFLGLWFLIGLFVSGMSAAVAYNRVMLDFRTLAERRYTPQPGFWQKLSGRDSG